MTTRTLPAFTTFLLSVLLVAGCAQPESDSGATESIEMPVLETRADTVAMKVFDAYGGPEAWAQLPYLRFDFATGTDTSRSVHARHLWDRVTGDYRMEMPMGEDTLYVALFNVNSREGNVYMDGVQVDSTREAELLDTAYRRFINDTYWLLMPVKLMDPGVNRTYLPDSSTADQDVLHLSFGEVGLTPGDQYWVYVDAETGLVDQWAYRLQRHPSDHVPEPISWAAHTTFDTPYGEIVVSERKPRDGFVLYTDNVAVPAEVQEGAFTDPNPVL